MHSPPGSKHLIEIGIKFDNIKKNNSFITTPLNKFSFLNIQYIILYVYFYLLINSDLLHFLRNNKYIDVFIVSFFEYNKYNALKI